MATTLPKSVAERMPEMMWNPYTIRIVLSETAVVIAEAAVKRINFLPSWDLDQATRSLTAMDTLQP